MPSVYARARRYAGRAVLIVTLAVVQWGALSGPAWAKEGKQEAAGKVEKSYLLPYASVVLGVALGLIILLRPVKRDDEVQRKAKDEQN